MAYLVCMISIVMFVFAFRLWRVTRPPIFIWHSGLPCTQKQLSCQNSKLRLASASRHY